MSSLRVVILDSGLEVNEGHHDHFVRHARRQFEAHGAEVIVHGSSRIAQSVAQELGASPSFSRSLHDLISRDPYDGLLVDSFTCASHFSEEAERWVQDLSAPGDLVLVPTATVRELLGLAHLARRVSPTYRLASLFHRTGNGTFKTAAPGSLTGALLRNIGRDLSIFEATGLWLGAVTEPLRASLSAALDREVHLAPSPVWYSAPRLISPVHGLRVGFLGHIRLEKGALNIEALVRMLAVVAPEATSVVAGHHDRGGSDLIAFQALSQLGADVRLGWLDENAFADLVASCDLIVLPYDPHEYSDASSGIFSHAVAHAKPVVVPAATWMASQIMEGHAAGVAYPVGGVTEVAAIIKAALARLDGLATLARARSSEWRRRQCGARLVEQLLSFALGR